VVTRLPSQYHPHSDSSSSSRLLRCSRFPSWRPPVNFFSRCEGSSSECPRVRVDGLFFLIPGPNYSRIRKKHLPPSLNLNLSFTSLLPLLPTTLLSFPPSPISISLVAFDPGDPVWLTLARPLASLLQLGFTSSRASSVSIDHPRPPSISTQLERRFLLSSIPSRAHPLCLRYGPLLKKTPASSSTASIFVPPSSRCPHWSSISGRSTRSCVDPPLDLHPPAREEEASLPSHRNSDDHHTPRSSIGEWAQRAERLSTPLRTSTPPSG
jgi:hypothetical protein